MNIEVLPNIRV